MIPLGLATPDGRAGSVAWREEMAPVRVRADALWCPPTSMRIERRARYFWRREVNQVYRVRYRVDGVCVCFIESSDEKLKSIPRDTFYLGYYRISL